MDEEQNQTVMVFNEITELCYPHTGQTVTDIALDVNRGYTVGYWNDQEVALSEKTHEWWPI